MQPSPTTVAPEVLTLFDAISLVSGIAGIILAVVAIWLSWAFKRDADTVNQKTQDLLIEIRSDAKAIGSGVMSELRAYGESVRGSLFEKNPMTTPTVVAPTLHLEAQGEVQTPPEPAVSSTP